MLLLIPFIKSSNRFKLICNSISDKLRLPSWDIQSIFDAEIADKKLRYIRGKDSVHFRSKFDGRLTYGFFANQIFAPKRVMGNTVYVDSFDDHTPDVSENRRYVTSRCKETLEHWSDNGKLDGRIKTDWKEWSWDIPEFAPLREYKVKMMVWNTLEDGKKEPFITIEDTFEVIDPDSSHYDRWRSVSV
jgi:hypothetical protein